MLHVSGTRTGIRSTLLGRNSRLQGSPINATAESPRPLSQVGKHDSNVSVKTVAQELRLSTSLEDEIVRKLLHSTDEQLCCCCQLW